MERSMLIRIITGLGLLPLAVFILYQGGVVLVISAFLLFLAINYEYLQMTPGSLMTEKLLLFIVNIGMLMSLMLKGFSGLGGFLIFATIFIAILSCLWVDRSSGKRNIPVESFYLGLCYIGGLGSFMVYFVTLPGANVITGWILAIVVFSDTFAYFGGKYFGKTKLSETISPNKTVFGMFSGLVGALIAAVIVARLLDFKLDTVQVVVSGFIIASLAQSGDLFESLVKRRVGVKDSGRILPGHGGILDRIDALLFALPVGYLILLI